MSVVSEVLEEIDQCLGELREESERLEEARTVLLGEEDHSATMVRHRAPPGHQEERVFAVIRVNAGITTREIAEETKIARSQTYRIVSRLLENGRVVGSHRWLEVCS